jgi:phage tail tape-measure protein
MATKTPRIQVTLSEEAYRTVDELAKLQGSNRSRIVAELVNDLAPVLDGLLASLRAAARIREENIKGVRDASYEALERLQPLVGEAEETLALLELMFKRAGEEPPTSNTGVTGTPSALKSFKTAPLSKKAQTA